MSVELDTVFNPGGSDWSLLFDMIGWVEALLAEGICAIDGLPMCLEAHQGECPLQSKHGQVRSNALVNAVITLLKDNASIALLIGKLDDYDLRYIVSILLGWFGQRAVDAIPALVGVASGTSSAVEAAKIAIIRIGHAQVEILKWLQVSIVDDDDGSFRELVDLMVRINPHASQFFIDLLTEGSKSVNPDVREAVAHTINRLDLESTHVMSNVRALLLADPNLLVRQAMSGT